MSHRQLLNLIAGLVHQNLVVALPFSLESSHPVKQPVQFEFFDHLEEIGHRLQAGKLALVCQLYGVATVEVIWPFHVDRQQVLDNLNHQDPVVPLSCYPRMCTGHCFPEDVGSEVALPSCSLSHDRDASFRVPPHQGLVHAASDQEIVFMAFGIGKDSLRVVVEHVEAQHAGNEGNQGIFLKLIVEDRGFRFPIGTDSFSLLGVFDGDVGDQLEGSQHHRSDAETAAEQPLSNFEEPLLDSFDIGGEGSSLIHVGVLVHHVDSGHSHLVELQSSVVDSIETHLDAHIVDLNSRVRLEILIPDGHQEGVDSLMFPLDVGLGEDKGVVGVDCSVGDPILLGGHRRAIDNKLFLLLIIVSSGLHLDSIIAIPQLSQAETASDFQTVNLIKDPFVPLGVQSNDGSAQIRRCLPKRLQWTVNLVAADPETFPIIQWAVKMLVGSLKKFLTETKPDLATLLSCRQASYLWEGRSMLYLGVHTSSSLNTSNHFSFFSYLSWKSNLWRSYIAQDMMQ